MSNYLFQNVKAQRPKRNSFNLSHERKFSFNMAELVPILCEEVVPGDSWRMNTEVMLRLAPLVSPVMHRVNVYTHFFFVPNRLVWEDWQDFITGGEDGLQSPVLPYINIDSLTSYIQPGTLADFLGVQAKVSTGAPTTGYFSSLPFRAYQLIYNEYYRDQNLQTKITFGVDSGEDSYPENIMTLRTRDWEKDYFTSCLPETQKGSEVELPLGDSAPIDWTHNANRDRLRNASTGAIYDSTNSGHDVVLGDDAGYLTLEDATTAADFNIDNSGHLTADLSSATAATINDLRTATRLQRWLERNARNGSRYIEQILAHFGVMSSDARLQRPEYLGGGKSPVVISEVLQTSETGTSPQANMAGHGISVGNTHGFTKYFEEHGYIIGIMSVMPKTAYDQGVRRHFLKTDKLEFFWPEFAHLGEQEVYTKELYYSAAAPDLTTVFGYQSRYSEYKFIPSSCHGDFRDTLNFWHMGREFSSEPTLNSSFVTADPTHRVFADTDTGNPKLYAMLYNNISALRPMPTFGTPMF